MSLVWGIRMALIILGVGIDAEELRREHFSFFGPSFESRSVPERLGGSPTWMQEDDGRSGMEGDIPSGKAFAPEVPSWAALTTSLPGDQGRGVPRRIGQGKPEDQNPPRQEPPFDPPHASWAGVGNHFSGEAWSKYVWDDYLATPEILIPVGFAVSAAAISHWDKPLQRHWDGLLGNHRSYSDIGQYTLIGLVVLDGILLPGEGRTWWDEAWTIGEAYGASSLMVYILKTGVQRPRPGGSSTGIGTHSFPSGHANSSFTAATLIERNSGPLFGLPAYGLAAFTSFERVEEGHHYPSDILASAAIGTFFASVFDSLHWGTGPGDGGIARPPPEATFGFLDGLHGFTLELSFGF